jgi:DNA-binding winged helix-turn-helix (wHTH) protein
MGLMPDFTQPLPPDTTNAIYNKWLHVIDRKEHVLIASLSPWDRHYRAAQFLEQETLLKPNFDYKRVYLQSERIEEKEQLIRALPVTNRYTVFMIMDGEWLLQGIPYLIPALNEYLMNNQGNMSLLTFCECSPFLIPPGHPITQNVVYSSLYSPSEICHFITHVTRKYDCRIEDKKAQQIVEECGGHIWLIKQSVRHYQETGKVEFDYPEMEQKLKTIWNQLGEYERDVLAHIVDQRDFDINEASAYLHHTGLINSSGITIPIFEKFIRKQINKNRSLLVINHHIMVGRVDITVNFTQRERSIIELLYLKRDGIVSRDEIGGILWVDNEEGFSDWAINQAIKRLRNRINQFIPQHHYIKTIKGKGLRWE